MSDIQAIIKYLDNYLEQNNLSYIGAVEANYLLDKVGLLNDNNTRKGKPLRDLLRNNQLPYAYQTNGKNSTWIIPHSRNPTSHSFVNSQSESLLPDYMHSSKKEVFVTYSWDNEEHCNKVISFTDYLRKNGFDAEIDRMLIQEETAIDFKKMMHKAMTDYKKVIVVLSKGYKIKAESFQGGVGNEYELILNDIVSNKDKYILVSFDGINNEITPLFFRGKHIIDLSKNKFEELYAKLLNKKLYQFSEVADTKPIIKPKNITDFVDESVQKLIKTANLSYHKSQNKSEINLEEFCNIISGEENQNILKVLNLPLSKFEKASQKDIDSNPTDKKNGVIEVYVKINLKAFGIFDNCVHKIYKNGDKQYFFYTTTNNPEVVKNTADVLYNCFGGGIYDDRINHSFYNIDKIMDIAEGFCSSLRDECHTMWSLKNNLTVHLNYHVNPLMQFVLLIDEKIKKQRVNISRNDSLLNYINFDLNTIITNSNIIKKEIEKNKVKYIDYINVLPSPFLSIFTKIKIRIFGNEKLFNEKIQTHLFFYTKNNILNKEEIISVTNSLLSIYGTDNTDLGKLKEYELNNINEFGSWLGRRYDFNDEHKLYDDQNNTSLYTVEVVYDEFMDEGLCLSIIGFNDMFSYMQDNLLK